MWLPVRKSSTDSKMEWVQVGKHPYYYVGLCDLHSTYYSDAGWMTDNVVRAYKGTYACCPIG